MINAYDAKTQTDSFYKPDMVDEFIDKVEAEIQEAAANGDYSVTIGTESVPSVVVDSAVTTIQEAGYKTNRKDKTLTVLWDKATEPVE